MPNPTETPSDLAALIWRALASVLAVAVMLLLGARALGEGLGLSDAFAFKVTLVFVCATIWLGIYLQDHLPHVRLGPANQVTLARLGLTVLLVGFFGEPQVEISWVALGIATVVLILDGVDGWLARRYDYASAFGARFDMETDALLMLLLAALAWQFDKAGAWVLLSGAMRYAFIAAAVIQPWLRRPLQPSRRRKAVCVLQIVSLLLALAPFITPPWSGSVAAAGLLLLCYSFTIDIVWLWRQARHSRKESIVNEHV